MHITYHGLSCFKIVAKSAGRGSDDVVIVFAPFDKSVGLRPPQAQADIVLVPHADPTFANASALRGDPVVVYFPGEYAIKGVNIIGADAPADTQGGAVHGNTVVFMLEVEGLKIAYLGALGGELTPDQLDLLAQPDVLFVPVGGEHGLDGKSAETIARKIEPKIIIPMQYKIPGIKGLTLRSLEDFCSNIGNCPKSAVEKLLVKADDNDNTMEVVTLKVV